MATIVQVPKGPPTTGETIGKAIGMFAGGRVQRAIQQREQEELDDYVQSITGAQTIDEARRVPVPATISGDVNKSLKVQKFIDDRFQVDTVSGFSPEGKFLGEFTQEEIAADPGVGTKEEISFGFEKKRLGVSRAKKVGGRKDVLLGQQIENEQLVATGKQPKHKFTASQQRLVDQQLKDPDISSALQILRGDFEFMSETDPAKRLQMIHSTAAELKTAQTTPAPTGDEGVGEPDGIFQGRAITIPSDITEARAAVVWLVENEGMSEDDATTFILNLGQ